MTTQRKEIRNEQFFTNDETAARLARFLESQSWFTNVTRVIEPSAGDGAWLRAMHVDEAYDIEPMHPDVQKIDDFLTHDCTSEESGKLLYVGNPPFGRMGKLAKAFINKCAETGDYIAFILPASMAKVTQIRQLNKNLHLIYQEDLLDETFRFERDGKVVSTVFQVWERRPELRIDPKKRTSCDDFSFVKTSEVTYANVAEQLIQQGVDKGLKSSIVKILAETLSQRPAEAPTHADLAICTHGSGVGKIHTGNFKTKSTRTHRFIQIDSDIDKKELTKRLRSLDYESIYRYSTGATCVSKEEIVQLYEAKYGK